ncbi:leucine-rich repeat-containing protein 9-like [Cucumis sativus]|uniref:leucine-rich repeat-containing protein 9-like n=1 Tax=Cucumis sativus TaxID=3659 RepID=UPI0012F4CAD3|nr:leucine-rich repeat-containing protein 9-like [Cucumis sativus]XP_031744724.1 leucine-rich repeat-containing protein 9-like [Cucumis sativus]XP_031744769.1 leucine-rich repeat-containing protein 9-like [Cucumis sativus]XP_031745308.1 leucine-rich repeat-containing protein 9-like [Cucumis sativus]XP_031745507.1 leucine-rich repeat-containing protein 9-like [Cucumis sativus]XP_031745511.1 leucine-rich repeat-containing protein 9-like [Cucumis sativus]XP_031745973.1 leucine-rich repeat-contai
MSCLDIQQVLNDYKTKDPLTITTLKLNQKALSDINGLSLFKNLEKLDLTFNNLTSLQGLESCTNLKWLSVVQNKLDNLKGIEGLSRLNVLNAGKNKLRSMDEIRPLVGFCALILNDNEIASICKLDQMKNLNTLVLSRNPIHSIGDSLLKVNSMKKLSLSNCKHQSIESLKFCIELKELRLAHNEIRMLPNALAHNKKLLNLDLGNNVIMRWSDLKVLSSLGYLRNIYVRGNPIAESAKLDKKICRLVPGLRVLNARSIDKCIQNENDNGSDKEDDTPIRSLDRQKEKKDRKLNGNVETHPSVQGTDGKLDHTNGADVDRKLERKKRKMDKVTREEKVIPSLDNKINLGTNDIDKEKKTSKQKRTKSNKEPSLPIHKETLTKIENHKKKAKKEGERQIGVIDDAEVPFEQLFGDDLIEDMDAVLQKVGEKEVEEMNLKPNLASFSANRKESKSQDRVGRLQISPIVEIGMDGISTWGDE